MKYKKIYPEVKFELREGNTYKIIQMLIEGDIEIGIVRTPFESKDMEKIDLCEEPMIAVMSKDYDFNIDGFQLNLSELEGKPLIYYRRFEQLINDTFARENIRLNTMCINDDARTTLLWAKAGMGIGILPKSAVRFERNDEIKYYEILQDNLKTKISAIWLKDRYLSTVTLALIEALSNKDI